MEREIWRVLYRTVIDVSRDYLQKYIRIPGWVLILTMLWAALHDRPICWACDPANWATTRLRPPWIPSPSTMSRRIDRAGLALLWNAIENRLRELPASQGGWVASLDGKPLPVGGATKDPDARYGRAAGTMAKGYKLHTIWAERIVPETWEVTPMNMAEPTVARRLLPQLTGSGYLLADGNYDSNALFDLASTCGYQLIVPLPKGKPGHQYQSQHRLHSIAVMSKTFGYDLYRRRISIEDRFGNLTSFGGGLGPLPAWVRGLDRTRTWVWAKLLINAARILSNNDLRKD